MIKPRMDRFKSREGRIEFKVHKIMLRVSKLECSQDQVKEGEVQV